MTRTCPHCHEVLPNPNDEELAELLGGLELTRALEPQTASGSGVGAWLATETGPAFVLDHAALEQRRQARLREHAEQRRR